MRTELKGALILLLDLLIVKMNYRMWNSIFFLMRKLGRISIWKLVFIGHLLLLLFVFSAPNYSTPTRGGKIGKWLDELNSHALSFEWNEQWAQKNAKRVTVFLSLSFKCERYFLFPFFFS